MCIYEDECLLKCGGISPVKKTDAMTQPVGQLNGKLYSIPGTGELPEYDEEDAGKVLTVNDDGDGVEWATVSSGGTKYAHQVYFKYWRSSSSEGVDVVFTIFTNSNTEFTVASLWTWISEHPTISSWGIGVTGIFTDSSSIKTALFLAAESDDEFRIRYVTPSSTAISSLGGLSSTYVTLTDTVYSF